MREYIDIYRNGAAWDISEAILKHLLPVPFNNRIVVLCIGTDRSTGDSLGPLVGYRLSQYHTLGAQIAGTLEQPVHAKNLPQTLERLQTEVPDSFTIAIDACLGTFGHVGQVTIGTGPLKPGSGLKKDLPETGDMHITGIVNQSGWMDFMVLQNTRLGLVMKMAETISDGLRHALWKYRRYERDIFNRYIQ
ncbi:MAG: spore protease YyaC [Thermoclostridium sp.]|nr:spore protease YyaC [Thermoclostridium sp.]